MTSMPSVPMTTQSADDAVANSMSNRYVNAYRNARFQSGLGATIKTVSLVVGAIVDGLFLLNILGNLGSGGMFGPNILGASLGFFGLIVVTACGAIGWILGTLIAAQGELVKATLDSAVNTSPFLEDRERARIMSLY